MKTVQIKSLTLMLVMFFSLSATSYQSFTSEVVPHAGNEYGPGGGNDPRPRP
jgi:hypothetical protein